MLPQASLPLTWANARFARPLRNSCEFRREVPMTDQENTQTNNAPEAESTGPSHAKVYERPRSSYASWLPIAGIVGFVALLVIIIVVFSLGG
jgi:hypothetical protein